MMCNIGFPGSERYSIYGETSELESLLEFFSKASALMHLKRTGKTSVIYILSEEPG